MAELGFSTADCSSKESGQAWGVHQWRHNMPNTIRACAWHGLAWAGLGCTPVALLRQSARPPTQRRTTAGGFSSTGSVPRHGNTTMTRLRLRQRRLLLQLRRLMLLLLSVIMLSIVAACRNKQGGVVRPCLAIQHACTVTVTGVAALEQNAYSTACCSAQLVWLGDLTWHRNCTMKSLAA